MFTTTNKFVILKKFSLMATTSLFIVAWFTIFVFKQTYSFREKLFMKMYEKSFRTNVNISNLASHLDLYNLGPIDQVAFFNFKEKVYARRRDRIVQYCRWMGSHSKEGKNPDISFNENSIIYNTKDKIAYCQIPKVASSTWCKHFAILSRAPVKELIWWKNAIQIFAPQVWPLPNDGRTLKELFENLKLSMVIVRHPFSRLASVYYEKFIYTNGEAWTNITKYIIQKYRRKREKPNMDENSSPAPSEFLQFVIETLMIEGDQADNHWLQQSKSCPFCAVNFTVYSKMEELAEDTAFIILKGNLIGKISPDLQDNSVRGQRSERERNFWSNVPTFVIKNLTHLYKSDLEMFDYSVESYFKELNLRFLYSQL